MAWSEKRTWPLDRPEKAVPTEIKSGDWVMTDLGLRADWCGVPNRRALIRTPDYCPAFVWRVETGESFQLSARHRSCADRASHMVVSYYRVWEGGARPVRTGVVVVEEPPRKAQLDTTIELANSKEHA